MTDVEVNTTVTDDLVSEVCYMHVYHCENMYAQLFTLCLMIIQIAQIWIFGSCFLSNYELFFAPEETLDYSVMLFDSFPLYLCYIFDTSI